MLYLVIDVIGITIHIHAILIVMIRAGPTVSAIIHVKVIEAMIAAAANPIQIIVIALPALGIRIIRRAIIIQAIPIPYFLKTTFVVFQMAAPE